MIEDKFVDLYARNSGLRDKLVAERLDEAHERVSVLSKGDQKQLAALLARFLAALSKEGDT